MTMSGTGSLIFTRITHDGSSRWTQAVCGLINVPSEGEAFHDDPRRAAISQEER